MQNFHALLQPDAIYHVYSRAVGNEKLFREADNYHYFLKKYAKYILPIADTFAWCLLPNHFHFLVRIKSLNEISAHWQEMKKLQVVDYEKLPDFLMERFSNLLNSYTKSFNKVYDRKGALFIDYLRRVIVTKDDQFGATVFYIHKNPVHHGYCKALDDWKWSSYKLYIPNCLQRTLRKRL